MSFSTSDALKDWIKRYVGIKRRENPNDRRYNSFSSFIHCSLEELMKLYEKGKDLNDFNKVIDEEIENFYEQITFKALIPQFEASVEMNRYIPLNDQTIRFFRIYRHFIFSQINPKDTNEKNLIRIIEKFNNFLRNNKVSKGGLMTVDGKKIIIEFEGKEKNLHFELSKGVAAIIGSIGGQILKVTYLPNYTRFDCEYDSIFNQKIPNIKEQIALSKANVEKFLKYEYLLKDKKEHLWINTCFSENALISFKNFESGINFIKSKLDTLKASINVKDLPKYCLRIFERFNWIIIDNEEELSFRFSITETEHKMERAIVKEILKNELKFLDDSSSYLIRKNI
ncbi:MAG: hypothetical protein ACFFCV_22100 [Promethearchaeota archaeon]